MHSHVVRFLVLAAAILSAVAFPTLAEDGFGRIEGRVTAEDGGSHVGVSVVIHETSASALTDGTGSFSFARVPAGTYTLLFLHAGETVTMEDVVVTPGATTVADLESEWTVTFVETLTVYAASRKQERVVEAPAAVTVVGEEQIERESSHGQLPKLLEFTPGVEVTQSGLYDYNFNTRGFNSSLNRRVATLIDGRNPSVPFLGAQEWSAVSFPLDDVASLELVRGPSSALYGANASSGVLNITTKQARYSEGGTVRLTLGDLDTVNADFRYADALGGNWFFKVNAGVRNSGDFSVSRTDSAEYSVPCQSTGQTDCLPQEALPLDPLDDNEIAFGNVRLDKYFRRGDVLSIEAGTAEVEGPVTQTGIGRVQLQDVSRPWARVNYSMEHFNFLAYYTGRQGDQQTALATGANLVLDTERFAGEVQTNWSFAGDKMRVVGGASYTREEIDSLDPATGLQTLMFRPVDSDARAVFGQFDWQVVDELKLVFAARWDGSSLHDDQLSPKASVVYSMNPNHSLRLTYNEAFQVANYSEFFLQAGVAPNADLSQFEAICRGNNVSDCGLAGPSLPDVFPFPGTQPGPGTSVLALGNNDLEVEETKTYEIGYSAILGNKAFLTLDYYTSRNENFITDLLPNAGTPLGRINPDFGPWVGSTDAETTINNIPIIDPDTGMIVIPGGVLTVAETIRALCAGSPTCGGLLSNNFDGANIIAARSYTNFGDVDAQGADLGLNYFITDKVRMSLGYSWFDFDIKGNTAGLDDLLVPNSPEWKGNLGFSFVGKQGDIGLNVRWMDEFRWVVGPFQGNVKSFTTFDLNGNVALSPNWTVGINIANLLDDGHWEAFGGDLLGRRALIHAAFTF